MNIYVYVSILYNDKYIYIITENRTKRCFYLSFLIFTVFLYSLFSYIHCCLIFTVSLYSLFSFIVLIFTVFLYSLFLYTLFLIFTVFLYSLFSYIECSYIYYFLIFTVFLNSHSPPFWNMALILTPWVITCTCTWMITFSCNKLNLCFDPLSLIRFW